MKTNEEILLPILKELYQNIKDNNLVVDKSGVKISELICPTIVLNPSQPLLNFNDIKKTAIKYAEAELEWYNSMDLNVEFISKHASIWKNIASTNNKINSNYGWCIYSKDNYNQYNNALNELILNKDSRRSCMIYTRPSIQYDYNKDGMSDFICTTNTQHFIRNNKLTYIVNMRSNDLILGFFNDFYWHCHVYNKMYNELQKKYNLEIGNIIWIANSLHVYERHFPLLCEILSNNH